MRKNDFEIANNGLHRPRSPSGDIPNVFEGGREPMKLRLQNKISSQTRKYIFSRWFHFVER